MSDDDKRVVIRNALARFDDGALADNTRHLLQILGYRSDRTLAAGPAPESFLDSVDPGGQINREKALVPEWQSANIVFQLTDENIGRSSQGRIVFDSAQRVDDVIIHSYLFVAIGLASERYTRTQLARITREVNKVFPMPALILFRHGESLSLAVIHRRLNKRDPGKDVLEKVTLIKDIRFRRPHRAHLEILCDLTLEALHREYQFDNFVGLQRAWEKALDSSELNKRFFKEIANWYFWAVDEVSFPEGAGGDESTRNAVSVIRLITRLIFVWFLKEKGLVPDVLFSRHRLQDILRWEDANDSTYYKAILQNLFFATLNQEMNRPGKSDNRKFRGRGSGEGARDQHYMIPNVYRYERYFVDPDAALDLFADIPFLNGGLFECLDRRTEAGEPVRVDSFSDRDDNPLRVPDDLFFGPEHQVDLNDAYGTTNKRYKARGLIDTLHRYKFTVEENTPIEEEMALDPELLGRVFENLLAAYNPETETTARKETGSFYTPREVVNFMVDESLVAYLEARMIKDKDEDLVPEARRQLRDRLRHLLAYNEEEPLFDEAEVVQLIHAVDDLDILDPACGSGAFPMGILHKLVFILGKLDPGNKRWRDRQIAKAEEIDDWQAKEAAVSEIEASFAENELDYSRKLYLIQNCIYGVDIQPIAVQIAKLRFFISLIVDQTVNDRRPNRGVLPLPNLETRFVAANTLLSLKRPPMQTLRSAVIIEREHDLEEVRRRLFTARTWQTKNKYRQRDKALRQEIGALLGKEGFGSETTQQLAAWDPYAQNISADFFDPEWMFGIREGFDIVIGNPPYIRVQTLSDSLKQALKRDYDSAKWNYDLYVVFVENGLRILSESGILAFILPHKFFNARYGAGLRRIIAQGSHLQKIVHFGDQQVFAGATNYTCLLFLSKVARSRFQFTKVDDIENWYLHRKGKTNIIRAEEVTESEWNFFVGQEAIIAERLQTFSRTLGDVADIFVGVQTSADPVYILEVRKRELEYVTVYSKATRTVEKLEAGITKAVLRGSEIDRYGIPETDNIILFPYRIAQGQPHLLSKTELEARYPKAWSYLQSVRKKLEARDRGKFTIPEWWQFGRNQNISEMPKSKIMTQVLARQAAFTIDHEGEYCFVGGGNAGGYGIRPKPSSGLGEYFLVALLNSKLLDYYLQSISTTFRGGYYSYARRFIERLPIADASEDELARIESLVKRIYSKKRAGKDADIASLEAEIDRMVYLLYGLRSAEIAIVEGRDADEIDALLEKQYEETKTSPEVLSAPPLMFTGHPPQGSFNERMKRVQELARKSETAAIQELTAALGDEEYTIRYLAGSTLRQIGGPEVVGVLKAYLEQVEDGVGREEAKKVLRMLGDS